MDSAFGASKLTASQFIANPEQDAAVEKLKHFLVSDCLNFLLLGSAGSGKTTTIVRAFDKTDLNVMFCAFTNKATSVLQNMTRKFKLSFNASFSTIHTLLGLQPKYSDNPSDSLQFEFRESAIIKLVEYDVIIFDECSTISKDLYPFVEKTRTCISDKYEKTIKYIFLGDFWQIPPVHEKNGIIFATAISEMWPVSKLSKIMRSNNQFIYDINTRFLAWIDLYKTDKNNAAWKELIEKYPYNLVKASTNRYLKKLNELILQYYNTYSDDSIILTHSRKNCEEINNIVQDLLDSNAGRSPRTDKTKISKFYVNDRCCLEKPIILTKLDREYAGGDLIITVGEELPSKLYNGEIFDVIVVEDAIIKTPISRFSQTFHGQVLTISRTTMPGELFEIVFIKQDDLKSAYAMLKRKLKKPAYISMVTTFNKYQPILMYGYCVTIYKSQGSQWKNVYINMRNIWWSLCGQLGSIKDNQKKYQDEKMLLFKLTYTAVSRASDELYLFW